MVDIVKNSDGFVIGIIEWNLLNELGQFSNNAKYIYIASCWIHERYRKLGVLSSLIDIIYKHPYSREADKVYWDFVRINGKRITDNTLPYFDKFKAMGKIYDKEKLYNRITKGLTDDKRTVPQHIPV